MKVTVARCPGWILLTAEHEFGTTYCLTELAGPVRIEDVADIPGELAAEAVAELLKNIGGVR